MPFKVVVLGAGVSGLMAAKQLQYFGLDVIVLEARVSSPVLPVGDLPVSSVTGRTALEDASIPSTREPSQLT